MTITREIVSFASASDFKTFSEPIFKIAKSELLIQSI